MIKPRRVTQLLAVATLAFATAFTGFTPARRETTPSAVAPKHMLFRVRGPAGATVYILGSVHLLTADASTLPAEVDTAFAHAKVLVLETSLDSAMMRAPDLLEQAKYKDGATLRSSLSPGGVAKVDSVLRNYGLNAAAFDAYKPWFVSMVMSQLAMQRAKFESQYGVDMQLNARANAVNKRIVGLEPVEFQLTVLDNVSPADQERMVLEMGSPDSAVVALRAIKDAWLAGDLARLDSIVNKDAASMASFQDALVYKRNAAWVPKIEAYIKGTEDALVVVGAAHLVGKRGVLELLRARGYTIEQL